MTEKQIARTAERLIRAAYEFEAVAARLHEAGKPNHARGVKEVTRSLGNIGRDLR